MPIRAPRLYQWYSGREPDARLVVDFFGLRAAAGMVCFLPITQGWIQEVLRAATSLVAAYRSFRASCALENWVVGISAAAVA